MQISEPANLSRLKRAIEARGWSAIECLITNTIAVSCKQSDLLIGFFPADISVEVITSLETTDQLNMVLSDTGWSITEEGDAGCLIWMLWDHDDNFVQKLPFGLPSKTVRQRILDGTTVFVSKLESKRIDGWLWEEYWEYLGLTGYIVSLPSMVVQKIE